MRVIRRAPACGEHDQFVGAATPPPPAGHAPDSRPPACIGSAGWRPGHQTASSCGFAGLLHRTAAVARHAVTSLRCRFAGRADRAACGGESPRPSPRRYPRRKSVPDTPSPPVLAGTWAPPNAPRADALARCYAARHARDRGTLRTPSPRALLSLTLTPARGPVWSWWLCSRSPFRSDGIDVVNPALEGHQCSTTSGPHCAGARPPRCA